MKKNHDTTKTKIRFTATILAASMLLTGLTACSNRNKDDAPPEESTMPDQTTPPEQPTPPTTDAPQEPATPEDSTPGDSAPAQTPGNSTAKTPPTIRTEESTAQQIIGASPITETLSGDFAQLASLSSNKLGWGPGGPVDTLNRSSGALSYQEKYGQYNADFIGENQNQIYLTFDEGYENGFTGKILDVLKEKQVTAVFFVTMPYTKSNPDLIRRMIEEGHIVGNHSVTHPSFPDTPLTQCQEEIIGLHNYILENYNYEMTLFRFPMGEFSEQNLKLVQECGYRSVFWSFAYRDWLVEEQPDPTEALTKILDHAHPGGIFLLHAVSQTNTEILGQVIDGLQQKGFQIAAYPTAAS